MKVKGHRYVPRFELRRRESVHRGIARLADSLAKGAEGLAGSDLEISEAIHEMRLLLKHFRALWRLLRPRIGRPVADREIQKLRAVAGRLAQARDATVGLRTLDTLSASAPGSMLASIDEVRRHFTEKIRDGKLDPTQVRRTLVSAAAVGRSSATALARLRRRGHGWSVIEAGLKAGYRRARRRLGAAQATSEEAKFHACRTSVKSLLYQVTLVRGSAPGTVDRLRNDLDCLQDTLGTEHDLAVLGERFRKAPRKFGGETVVKPALRLIASRQQRLRKLAFKHARRPFADKPRSFMEALEVGWKRWRKG